MDNQEKLLQQLAALKALPRPVMGETLALPNQAIQLSHQHPWIQLSYAAEGVITVETPRARLVAPPDKGVWIPPGMEHGVIADSHVCIRSIYVRADMLPESPCQVIKISPLLRELILNFSQFPVEYDESGMEGRLVAVLLDQLALAPPCELILPWPAERRLLPVCRYLALNPDSQLPMAHFSQQLGVSDRTLSRLFVEHTGMSFRYWRQRCRLLSALPLLGKGMKVTDVALECGYDSLSAFSAAFGELMGSTPSQYTQDKGGD